MMNLLTRIFTPTTASNTARTVTASASLPRAVTSTSPNVLHRHRVNESLLSRQMRQAFDNARDTSANAGPVRGPVRPRQANVLSRHNDDARTSPPQYSRRTHESTLTSNTLLELEQRHGSISNAFNAVPVQDRPPSYEEEETPSSLEQNGRSLDFPENLARRRARAESTRFHAGLERLQTPTHHVAPSSQHEEDEERDFAIALVQSLLEAEGKAPSENEGTADPELQRALQAVREAELREKETELQEALKAIEEAELQEDVRAIDEAHSRGGSPALTGMSPGDYSDASIDELMPFLENTHVNAHQPARPSAAQLREGLTRQQRELADLLIPAEILAPQVLEELAQYEAGQQREIEGKWRHAMELLIYHCNSAPHTPSVEEVDLMEKRRNAPKVGVEKLDENFDPKRVILRNTPGGGDCIVHALEEGKTGLEQSPEDVLLMRQEIAAMRSSNPDDYRSNRSALVQALNDTAPRFAPDLSWDQLVPEEVSNELFAAFQACPGMYSGTDMIAQWTMLPGNRDKTVIAIDDGGRTPTLEDGRRAEIQPDVMAYRNGERVSIGGKLTNAMLDDHLRRGDIVIKQSGQHWQSLNVPLINFDD